MRHTETNSFDVERLLHVKGRKRVMATEVSSTISRPPPRTGPWRSRPGPRELIRRVLFQVEMSWESFNLGDVFLLDVGKSIVQWNGPQSNRQERLKASLEDSQSDVFMSSSLLANAKRQRSA